MPCVVGRAEVGVPRVEVRIEVQHGDGPVLARAPRAAGAARSCGRRRSRRAGRRCSPSSTRARLDLATASAMSNGFGDEVARVGDLLRAEREHVLRGVVRAQQPRGLAHVRRAEAGARAGSSRPLSNGTPTIATSARPTSSRRGSRAKVAMPANRGTTLASTGPRMSRRSVRRLGASVGGVAYYETFSTLEDNLPHTVRPRPPASSARRSGEETACVAIHPSADAAGTPIGAKLRSTRMAQGLTLAQVAESTGLARASSAASNATRPRRASPPSCSSARCSRSRSARSSPSPRSSTSRAPTPRTSTSAASASTSCSCRRGARSACSCCAPSLEPGAHGGHDLYTVNCDVEVLHVVSGRRHRAVRRPVGAPRRRATRSPSPAASRTPGTPRTTHRAEVCWVLAPAPWSGSA